MEATKPLSDVHNTLNYSQSNFRTPTKHAGDSHVVYKDLLAKGKSAAAVGNLNESLEAYQKAYKIKPTEKILQRIKKLEEVIQEIAEDEENDDFVQLDNGLIIFKQLVERLYPHQIEGVKWIYDLQRKRKKGGILADDMGLGKTIQVISVLSAMFDMEIIRSVLLVLPLSLIPNWQREFEKWAPGIRIKAFYGSPKERTKNLDQAQRRPSVCITTYGLVVTQWEQLGQTKLRREFTWDYIILDEGHKIKNPSKTTKGLHAIPSKNRLILTGTPIQNNLRELWALFDWVTQGTLLGTQKTFKLEYETPIVRARTRGASSAEIHLGNYMAESLRKIIDPFILRRTKGSVSAPNLKDGKVDENQSSIGLDSRPSFPKLKKKNDFVIWTYLSEVQEEIYRDFLAQEAIKELLASKRSPLVYLTILKKICDHPRLLPRRACHQLGLEADDSLQEDDFHTDKGKECAANRIDNVSDETLIAESGKLQFLLELLKRLRDEGHRTLVFSLSRKVLNILHRILINNRFKVMRLDGTISKLEERELRVKKFQQDSSYNVFLLTTQVGGVGLTLTAADRVVIFDPSWNPATDAQAVDRIYRIGQDKNVVVYRLITCGTVEEKIYRRQIFKDSIIKQSTGDNKDPYRYFTNHELRELFQLEETRDSVTQRQLQELHIEQRSLGPELEEHLAYLHTLPMFGVSDHDLMFSQDPDDVDGGAMEEYRSAIQSKVEEARSRVELEARGFSGNSAVNQRWGDIDVRDRVYEPKIKEEEPKFEIEGLHDKLDSLKMEDDAIENIFNQSKISQPSEVKTEPEREVLNIPDSDDEFEPTERKSAGGHSFQDGDVLVEDSPDAFANRNKFEDAGPLEIGESFLSNFDTPNELERSKSRTTLETEDLLDSNISCIPIQRSRQSDITSKDDGHDEDLQLEDNENADTIGDNIWSKDPIGSGHLHDEIQDGDDGHVAANSQEVAHSSRDRLDTELRRSHENLKSYKSSFIDEDSVHLDLDEVDDSMNSEDDLAMNDLLLDLEKSGIIGADSKGSRVKVTDPIRSKGDVFAGSPAVSLSRPRDLDEEDPVTNDLAYDDDAIPTISPSEDNHNAQGDVTASPSLKVAEIHDVDEPLSDAETEINLDLCDSGREMNLNESGEEDSKCSFVDGDTPVFQSRKDNKKRRLIRDSESSTDGEDIQGENMEKSLEGDDSDADDSSGSLKNFIFDDEILDGAARFLSKSGADSPILGGGMSMKKSKRRSTALSLPRIDTSDESSDENISTYRDKANISSESEKSLSALQLSFQSDDSF